MKLLLPESEEWDIWWNQQQLCAQQISAIGFSEEYGIMIEDPLNDPDGTKIKEELAVRWDRCIRQADLPLGPELPRGTFVVPA